MVNESLQNPFTQAIIKTEDERVRVENLIYKEYSSNILHMGLATLRAMDFGVIAI